MQPLRLRLFETIEPVSAVPPTDHHPKEQLDGGITGEMLRETNREIASVLFVPYLCPIVPLLRSRIKGG